MKGTILDFLKLASEKPDLAKELAELAAKYDFEFTDDELSDADLEKVAGGTGWDARLVALAALTTQLLAGVQIQGGIQPATEQEGIRPVT